MNLAPGDVTHCCYELVGCAEAQYVAAVDLMLEICHFVAVLWIGLLDPTGLHTS